MLPWRSEIERKGGRDRGIEGGKREHPNPESLLSSHIRRPSLPPAVL